MPYATILVAYSSVGYTSLLEQLIHLLLFSLKKNLFVVALFCAAVTNITVNAVIIIIYDQYQSSFHLLLLKVTNTGHDCTEYGNSQNKIIEEAFQKKEKVARLVDDSGTVYIVNFDLMRDYPENNQDDFVCVIRRDKTGLSGNSVKFDPHGKDDV